MYVWLSLVSGVWSVSASPGRRWLTRVCRAAATVLMVGFWFDGGLFDLATASTFWILLELGRCSDWKPVGRVASVCAS